MWSGCRVRAWLDRPGVGLSERGRGDALCMICVLRLLYIMKLLLAHEVYHMSVCRGGCMSYHGHPHPLWTLSRRLRAATVVPAWMTNRIRAWRVGRMRFVPSPSSRCARLFWSPLASHHLTHAYYYTGRIQIITTSTANSKQPPWRRTYPPRRPRSQAASCPTRKRPT